MIPAISRLSSAALTATRASWSAVTAPAETASTVVAPRVVSATCGARPSTTATITISVAWFRSGLASSPAASRSKPERLGRVGAAEHTVDSVAVAFASC
jgi:hypothetical protein